MKVGVFLFGLTVAGTLSATGAVPEIPAEQTIFSYRFDADTPRADSGRLGPDLIVKPPAALVQEGKEDGGLKIASPINPAENANYAQLPRTANEMFPAEAVTVDFDFCPDETLISTEAKNVYLLDQMYTGTTGFQVIYLPQKKAVLVRVGNGEKLLAVTSDPLHWRSDKWLHLAFSYDAAKGELRLFENGDEVGAAMDPSFGPLDYGDSQLRVGNRLGSLYGNTPGVFDNLRMSRLGSLLP